MLTSALFDGNTLLEEIAADRDRISRSQHRDDPAVKLIQQALLHRDPGCLPKFGVDGDYGDETADAVRRFKVDVLHVSEAEVIDDVGPLTVITLDRLETGSTAPVEDPQVRYTDRKSHYTGVALQKAGSAGHPPWEPALGFAINRPQIVDVYAYYRDLALQRPEQFLWAGMGHMAGGAVVGGLDADPGLVDQPIMVAIGRDIFHDLAWLHEAFLDRPDTVVELAGLHDQFNQYATYDGLGVLRYERRTPQTSYARAWEQIVSGDPAAIAAGNRALLENEQWSIIQPHYDRLRTFAGPGLATAFTNNIHPYHRAFIVEVPQGDILSAPDRWSWITRPAGMLEGWVACGVPERERLLRLDFAQICRGDFGVPGRPDLLPPGGP